MPRVVRFSLIALLSTALIGCSPDLLGNFFPRSAVPPQVLAVAADPASFPPVDHPLRGVANGTIIDDLSGLSGFWGTTVPSTTTENADTGEITTSAEVSIVLEINVNTGTMKQYRFQRCLAPGGCGLIGQDGEAVVVKELEIQVLASNRYVQRFLPEGKKASFFNSNGDIDFNPFLLIFTGIDTEVPFETLFTVQGDFLKTLDGAIGSTPNDIIADGNEEAMTTLWVRIAP